MLTVGVDAHKRVNMAVAIDDAGREMTRWRGPNNVAGWRQLAAWAKAQGAEVCRGIEGAWSYGRGLAQQLVEAGATVYEVNARWTAAGRRRARTPGKGDGLDARAVALVVRREGGNLPPVTADDETGVMDLLVAEREGLVAESTRLRNQLHQLLLQLDPGYRAHIPSRKTQQGLRAVATDASTAPRPLQQQRAAAVRRLAQRLQLLVEQARELAAQIRGLAVPFAPWPPSAASICSRLGPSPACWGRGSASPAMCGWRPTPGSPRSRHRRPSWCAIASTGAGTGSATPSSTGSP